MKICSSCGEAKDESDFHKNKNSPDSLRYMCKTCNGLHARDGKLKREYGISLACYKRIEKIQGGLCLICGKPETATHPKFGTLKHLAVDHDHSNGKVRGLLCSRCNQGLGMFLDNPSNMRVAADYIEWNRQHKSNFIRKQMISRRRK